MSLPHVTTNARITQPTSKRSRSPTTDARSTPQYSQESATIAIERGTSSSGERRKSDSTNRRMIAPASASPDHPGRRFPLGSQAATNGIAPATAIPKTSAAPTVPNMTTSSNAATAAAPPASTANGSPPR